MNDKSSQLPQGPAGALRGLTTRGLARAIFAADVPEHFIRKVPAESLFLVVKENGLAASADLIEVASLEQCRLLLDFDCWDHGRFNEDNFWEWLALTDENNTLLLLQKLVKFVDLKLLALLIGKHVRVIVMEEPTEHPPSAGYYTPDKGYTWLYLAVEDGTRHFLLGRLLALIFETDAELFYQLISIPNVATFSVLEEESYQERSKRLLSEGIPDPEWAGELNGALDAQTIEKALDEHGGRAAVEHIPIVEPLVYEDLSLQPLTSLLREIHPREEFEAELTLLLNAGLVHWQVEFDRLQDVRILCQKVKGALNIGLESACALRALPLLDIYRVLGLQKLYRFGLAKLVGLRSLARRRQKELGELSGFEPAEVAILEAASQPFPQMPAFLLPDGTFRKEGEQLAAGVKAIETQEELRMVVGIIKGIGVH